MVSIFDRGKAALEAFNNPNATPTVRSEDSGRYRSLYDYWAGDWQYASMIADQRVLSQAVYKNTRQLWRQASAIVDLYDQFVYSGDLPSDGKPLPDGTRGAIPIDPQMSKQSDKDNLIAAVSEWWTMTNYRQYMSMRPKFGAILGDVLTELVDDQKTGAVRVQMLWPGHVKMLQLDLAGNVKAYSVEWQVEIPQTEYFGQRQAAQSYRYRKDVNGEGFYEYQDDVLVSQRANPYGFVPAIWDRHEIVFGDRGMSALDRTFQQAVELNSMLSNAMDYQARQFGSPIGVKGSSLGNRNKLLELNKRNSTGDPLADAAMVAQSLGLLPMTDNGEFVTIDFDIGKTVDMLGLVMDSILAENPEARYSQQILEMTQVTAPGVERALGPIIGRVKSARKNYDPQTVKLLQMAVAIMGWRVTTGGYFLDAASVARVGLRKERYDKFAKFGLESFDRGQLDFTIPEREVIPETIDEKVNRQVIVEGLEWEYSLRVANMPADEIAKVMAEREEAKARQDRLDEVMTIGVNPETGKPPQPGALGV